ncbi:MAG: TetR/AcrR family transcriptional regulator, partial [Oscillospiraceae bacterium]
KEEIIASTFKHFASHGYSLSMSEIAKDVCIKTPSLYSHFSGKDEIIYQAIEQEVASYYKFLNKVYKDNSDKATNEQLKNIFFTVVEYFKINNRLRFWKNVLLINNSDLREKSFKLVFDLENHHLENMKIVFGSNNMQNETNEDEIEANALLFLAMIQGALEAELLLYKTEDNADEYLSKIWSSYEKGICKS